MRCRTSVHLGAISLGLWIAMSTSATSAASWRCRAQPVEPCFEHHGRLSSQNGIALKIWLIGTTRVMSVENLEEIPSVVRKYLEMTSPDHSYIFGDFDICPLALDEPGHMRPSCVTGAERLVVQNLAAARPAFKLLSTWPADGAKQNKGIRKP